MDKNLLPFFFPVIHKPSVTGKAKLTGVGELQYSKDGVKWLDAIPTDALKTGQKADFYIRVNPASITESDDGSYSYDFEMVGDTSGGHAAQTGIGGIAVDTSEYPAVGHFTSADDILDGFKTFKFTVKVIVTDAYGTKVESTPIVGTWS